MRCQRTPGAPREDRYPESKQEVFENLDVALHRLPFDLALARHGGNVEWRGVREADGLEEARERADVTDEPLELNFLAEVQRGIAAEDVSRVGGYTSGTRPCCRAVSTRKRLPSSAAMYGCNVRSTARPPSRSTPARLRFRALDPVSTNCRSRRCSMSR